MRDFGLRDRFGRQLVEPRTGRLIKVPHTARFIDLFDGSPSDPDVDARLWTQTRRIGADTGVRNGKLVCDRVSFNNLGVFAGYAKERYETGVIDSIRLLGAAATFAAEHHMCIWFRHPAKSGIGPFDSSIGTGYELKLHHDSWGEWSFLTRWNNGSYSHIGSDFKATGFNSTPSDVEMTVQNVSGNVEVTLKINGVTVMTRTDTHANRILNPGYSGLAIRSDNTGDDMIVDGFMINA